MDKYLLKGMAIASLLVVLFVIASSYMTQPVFWYAMLLICSLTGVYFIFNIYRTVNRYIARVK